MSLLPPINFHKWLKENAEKLKPPVNNFCLYNGKDHVVMVVGGPNARNDYHVSDTEEWFYQVKGGMKLKVLDGEQFKDIDIEEGEMFLLPANTPHCPVRFANTVGLVVERVHPESMIDSVRWYCHSGKHSKPTLIQQERLHIYDMGTQLKPVVQRWREDAEYRRCRECGEVSKPQW